MNWEVAAWLMLGGSTLLLFLGLPVAFTFLAVNLAGAAIWMGGEAGVVELHDRGDQSVDTDRHQRRNAGQHRDDRGARLTLRGQPSLTPAKLTSPGWGLTIFFDLPTPRRVPRRRRPPDR